MGTAPGTVGKQAGKQAHARHGYGLGAAPFMTQTPLPKSRTVSEAPMFAEAKQRIG